MALGSTLLCSRAGHRGHLIYIFKTSYPFRNRNRSCLTNLLNFMKKITKYLNSGYPVDILYLDFQKAFDKVPNCRLVSKLAAHGMY